jgi:hypothetical protein
MAMDYKLLPSQNGKRVRIVSDDNQDINIVVGDILATWPEGTFIEILNLAPDPTAIVTLVGDTGVIVRQYDASNVLPYNHYARVSQVVPGEWDMHIYSALTLNDLTDVVITAPANNNVVLYDDTLLQWVNRPAPFVPTTQYKRMSYGGHPFDGSTTQGWVINDHGTEFGQPNYFIYDNDPYVLGFRFQQQGLYRIDWHIRASANPWPPTGVTSFMSERFSGGVQNINFRGLDSAIVYRPQWEVGFAYSDNFTWSDSDLINVGPSAITNGNHFGLSMRAYNAAEAGELVDFNVVMVVQRINNGVDGG